VEPFLGEIRLFAGTFAPRGWALCEGQLLPIAQNTALFSLLGTMYGGDGRTTFGLPDLRGRAPMAWGQGPGLSPYTQGEMIGSPTVTLTAQQVAPHQHALGASGNDVDVASPAGASPGLAQSPLYRPDAGSTAAASMVGAVGSGQAHPNQQPYLGLVFIIALAGIYPPRS
jgi:microcystin-dependent protein